MAPRPVQSGCLAVSIKPDVIVQATPQNGAVADYVDEPRNAGLSCEISTSTATSRLTGRGAGLTMGRRALLFLERDAGYQESADPDSGAARELHRGTLGEDSPSRVPRPPDSPQRAPPAVVLAEFVDYYNHDRPHRSLGLQAPLPSLAASQGGVVVRPVLGGLHHVYERAA